jgi:GTPase Era involved in 16S rRNA processing
MNLETEPVPPVSASEWRERAETLKRHGATSEEIDFLRCKRVELNAMSSRQLIDFIEKKFEQHGVEKVVPDYDVLEKHARHIIKRRLTEQAIAKISDEFTKQAEAVALPEDLHEQIKELLEAEPELPWDVAVARIIKLDADGDTP